MTSQLSFLRRAVKQVVVLIALAGLTFAAGIEWAEAATPAAGYAVPGAMHVVLIFAATIGFLIHAVRRAQRPARVRVRAQRRTPR